MLSRALVIVLLLMPDPAQCADAGRRNDLPPLAQQAAKWAATLPKGAVATAEKRDGLWSFAIAGEPFVSAASGAANGAGGAAAAGPAGTGKTPVAAAPAAIAPERIVFEIGSISKVFTGLLLAQAVIEGKLALDDPLSRRLPVRFSAPTGSVRDAGSDGKTGSAGAVTLRQLATHTSCLPRLPDNMDHATLDDPYARYDRAALFDYLATAKLPAPPCKADYSNLGFGILGVVLEIAYDKPWEELVQEKIARPLGMIDTVQSLDASQRSRRASPWAGAAAAQPWTFEAIAGAGALNSTLADMSRFADALLAGAGGPLGPAWTILAGDFADMPALGGKVGLALMHASVEGTDTYWHDGGTGGYRSVVQVQPKVARAAVVLASNAAATPSLWLTQWERGAQAPVARSEIRVPAEELGDYVGVYPIAASARFTIVRRGDGLVARLTGQPFIPIFASARDEFFYRAVDARISFTRDSSGRVTGLTLHQNGRDVPATRSSDPVPHVEFPAAAALDELRGNYDFGQYQPGATIEIGGAGETLLAKLTGQPALPVFATAKDRFDYDVVKATLEFERDAGGKVVAVILHQNGRDMRAPRR